MSTISVSPCLRRRRPTPTLEVMLDQLRNKLTSDKALPLLAIMGAVSGVLAAAVMVAFRLLVESAQGSYLPGGGSENFEQLAPQWRFILPVVGGLLIGMIWQLLREPHRGTGVVHVMERLAYYQGHLPLGNFLAQFAGAALCLIFGHSMGREGPSIHLGAASGSLLGQWLTLPNNSIRVLVACGVAGAIAASFNTPLAGVVFAMEVVMMEYTITGFAPVILAAVGATVVSRAVFGAAPAFAVPPLDIASMMELPYMFLMGLLVGVVSAVFIHASQWIAMHTRTMALWRKTTLAGVIMGCCALPVPEIMGIGYDTVSAALAGEIALSVLLLVLLVKVVASSVAVGFGLPGGLIGPTLFMGAMAGGVMGVFAQHWDHFTHSSSGFYAMLGMGAMMAATLNAPLAALMAMLELTNNPNIILPGMLVVISASLTVSHLFNKESIFLMLMRVRGLEYRADPVTQALQRLSVMDAVERKFVESPRLVEVNQAVAMLTGKPRWIIIKKDDLPAQALRAADLARRLEENSDASLDLMDIPGERLDLAGIYFQATLSEAQDIMDREGVDILYIWRTVGPVMKRIEGVITRHKVQSIYR